MSNKFDSKLILGIVLAVICLFVRFAAPIAPNFTPILAVALFVGVICTKFRAAMLIPFAAMLIGDLAFSGIHSMMFSVYVSVFLIALVGNKIGEKYNVKNISLTSFLGAIAFFLITNFAVWCEGWYGYSFNGLINCYVAAIPFFRYTLLSSFAYAGALFGIYFLAEKYVLAPSTTK
ncbi:MAG: hypothetical protein IJK61_00160 [Bacteroidetes bacterium]|nr:hypothetical protein [Bacteroidota bacterium]